MRAVDSSHISSIGYDETSKTLQIGFKSGATYRYTGVPANIHQAMLDSPSKGKFFRFEIKNKFAAHKIKNE